MDQHRRHWHWPFVYRRRRASLRKTTREIFIAQGMSLLGALVAGILLEYFKGTLAGMVGVFLLLPGIFDLGGSVAGAFGAKVNHDLQHTSQRVWQVLGRNLTHSYAVITVAAVMLGTFTAFVGQILFAASFAHILLVAVGGTLGTALIGLPLVGILTVGTRWAGLNPDNIIGPVETSIIDSISIIAVALIVGALL